ncbi:MAG: hypothetical protein L3I99_05140 [Sulfurimonas sp.]|nr:hypothetical protein [Sulfurimonas sp.]
MRAINPIYIALLLISILLISIFSLSFAKSDLIKSKIAFLETSQIANELGGLKKAYLKNSSSQKDLKIILNKKILKEAKLDIKFKKNSVSLKSDEMDKKALNFLMAKILNGTYNVVSMKIKKLSESKASFNMKISW